MLSCIYPVAQFINANTYSSIAIMTKATETFVVLLALSAIYFALYTRTLPSPEKFHSEILPYIPYWCLVTFGSYSLATLGWGVLTFKDKEAKYEELLKQIDEAKSFYKSKGLQLD